MDVIGIRPRNVTVDIAGQHRFRLVDLARLILAANEKPRRAIEDADARYFGAILHEGAILPSSATATG